MFSLLHRQTSISIGKLLVTDINIDLLNKKDEHSPSQQLTENLRISGYQYVIGAASKSNKANRLIMNTALPIRTVRLYDIEDDLEELLDSEDVETLGTNYVLIKGNWTIPSSHLEDGILRLQLNGYTPILAKSERYECLQDNYRNISRLLNRGCLLETDLISLTGYHGQGSKRLAYKLFKEGWTSFVGSGASNLIEQEMVNTLLQSKRIVKRLESLPLRNKELWETTVKNTSTTMTLLS